MNILLVHSGREEPNYQDYVGMYAASTLRKLGHIVVELGGFHRGVPVAREMSSIFTVAKLHEIQVVFFVDSEVEPRTLTRLQNIPVLTAFWGLTRSPINADIKLTLDNFPLAAFVDIFHPVPRFSHTKDIDVLIVGEDQGLAENLQNHFQIMVAKDTWRPQQMNELYNRSRLVITTQTERTCLPFEVAAARTLLLLPHDDYLESTFSDRALEMMEGDLVGLVRAHIDRTGMADEAYQEVLEKHTFMHRMKQLEDKIEEAGIPERYVRSKLLRGDAMEELVSRMVPVTSERILFVGEHPELLSTRDGVDVMDLIAFDDVENFPNRYDCAVFHHCLGEGFDPKKFLLKAGRAVAEEGILIFDFPNACFMGHVRQMIEEDVFPPGLKPYSALSLKDATDLLRRGGFDLESINRMMPSDGRRVTPQTQRVQVGALTIDLSPFRGAARENLFAHTFIVTGRKHRSIEYLQEKVSIVIPTYNGVSLLEKCLDSIKEFAPRVAEIIVVDDASTEKIGKMVHEKHPRVKCVRHKENLGFSAACNTGIKEATGQYVLLLNTDAFISPKSIERLAEVMEINEQFGLVGPVSNQISGIQRIQADYISEAEMLKFAEKVGSDHYGMAMNVPRITGFCMMVRRELIDKFKEVDGYVFDEGIGKANFEDDDICRRSYENDFGVVVARGVFVHHEGSATLNTLDSMEIFEASRKNYLKKLTGNDNKLSVCMIVKNEEAVLGRALTQLKLIADQIVVVDTGSTDHTKEIAESFGAEVHEFPWINNFAAARNASLQYATGDWIAWFDADDTIQYEDHINIRRLVGTEPNRSLLFVLKNTGSVGATCMQVRMFPNVPGVCFERPIHEQAAPSLLRAGITDSEHTQVAVIHTGYSSPEVMRQKEEMRLEIMEGWLKDHPEDIVTQFHLAILKFYTAGPDVAEPLFEKILETEKLKGEDLVLYVTGLLHMARCLMKRGELDKAKEYIDRSREPDDSYIYYRLVLGEYNVQVKNYPEALVLLNEVTQTSQLTYFPVDIQGFIWPTAHRIMGEMYEEVGEIERAIFHFQKAAEMLATSDVLSAIERLTGTVKIT